MSRRARKARRAGWKDIKLRTFLRFEKTTEAKTNKQKFDKAVQRKKQINNCKKRRRNLGSLVKPNTPLQVKEFNILSTRSLKNASITLTSTNYER
jgi:hypothetical protein